MRTWKYRTNKRSNDVKTKNDVINTKPMLNNYNKTLNKTFKSPSINKSKKNKKGLWTFLGFKSRK